MTNLVPDVDPNIGFGLPVQLIFQRWSADERAEFMEEGVYPSAIFLPCPQVGVRGFVPDGLSHRV